MIFVKKFLATGLQRGAALAVVAVLALLWSAVAWNHQDAERGELDEIRRETATLALLFANDVDITFRSVDHALLELRSAWVNRPADMGHEVKGYTEFLDEAILQIAVIGADGNLAYTNLGMPKEPTFLGEREYFKMHQGTLQDKLFVSRPLKGKVSGKWSIQLSRPVFRKAQFVGVVVISVDPNYFVKFYQNAGMGKDGAAGMLRDTGEVMAHSSGQDVYVGKVIDPSRYTSPGAPQQGSFRHKSQIDGFERLSSYYRLPQYGLTVGVGPSLNEHLAPLRSQQRQTLLAAGLITILVLLVAWLLLHAMVRKEAAHQALVVAEAAARDSSQRLNEVIWATHIATWEWQVQTGATVFNARWAEIVGCTLAELAPISIETWNKLVHPDDAMLSADLIARCFSRELDTYACEARIRHKDGHWVWVSDRGRVVEWTEDGKPLRMAGTHQDITERKQVEEKLKESEQRFRMLFDSSPDAYLIVATDSVAITDCNHATEVMLRGERAQILGKTPDQLSPLHQPDGRLTADAFAAVIHRLLQKGSHRFECLHQRLDGSDFWVDVSVSVAKMGLQQVLLVNWRDITELKQIQQALRSSEARSRHIFEKNTSVMLLIEPASGEILAANPCALAYYGYAEERLVGANIGLLNAMSTEAMALECQLALSEARNYFNFQHRLASGEVRDVEVYSTPIQQGGKSQLFSIVYDITSRKQAEAHILHLAQHDPLTGLANRALYTDRLQRALASARRDQTSLALMFIDLDKFKPVNDQFGHAVGDTLLQEVTQRMQACVRDSDTLARIGGDEFVVLLRRIAGEPEALAVAEKIRASLEQPFELAGHSLNISCSAGVALYPQHGLDDLALSKNADHAMYQAKERGRNQVVLYHAPPV